jgi:regulation of enolase protein 1 (concanavalin A-like superfamily)
MRVRFRRCDLLVAASARISQRHIQHLKKARFPLSFLLSFPPFCCSPNRLSKFRVIETEAKAKQTKPLKKLNPLQISHNRN